MASARPTSSASATRGSSSCTRPCTPVGSIKIELYFSILQRKVLTPNDLDSVGDLIHRIHAFGERYSALGKLFNWTITRQELERLLREPLLHLEPSASLHTAA